MSANINLPLVYKQGITEWYTRSTFVPYHLPIISISQYSPHSPSAAEWHMCISSNREGIMSRTSQHSSFIGCRLQPCCLPSHKALACSPILFYMSFVFSFLPNISLIFQPPHCLLSFNPFCSTYIPSSACSVYFWLGRIVQWSGSFELPLLLNRSLGYCLSRSFSIVNISQKNVIASWSPVLSFVMEGLWNRDILLERWWLWWGVEQSLSGDLPRSLCVRPLILNMHTYVAPLISTVLTFRKQPYAGRFVQFWDTVTTRMAAWGLSHGFLSKEAGTLKASCSPLLQHGLCLNVMCPEMFFTSYFQIERLVLQKCLLIPKIFKNCPQCLEVLHKILCEFYTWQKMLMLEAIVSSYYRSKALSVLYHKQPAYIYFPAPLLDLC